jgi:hypothetical protein
VGNNIQAGTSNQPFTISLYDDVTGNALNLAVYSKISAVIVGPGGTTNLPSVLFTGNTVTIFITATMFAQGGTYQVELKMFNIDGITVDKSTVISINVNPSYI